MKAWKLVLVLDVVVVAAVAFVYLRPHRTIPRTVRTGVVLVDATLGHGTRTEGTGFLLTSGGELITSNHVINGATAVHVIVPQTRKRYVARILGYDVGRDTAILQLQDAHGLRTAVTSSSAPRWGQQVLAVGGSTGAIASSAGRVTGLNASVTATDELGRSRHLSGMIEFDAAIEPGDSGGPLLDARGNVLGVNTAGVTRPDFFTVKNVHDSYATPIGTALSVAHDVEHGRASVRVHVGPTAYLGLELGIGGDVAGVVAGSPAARAGLLEGAQIATVDGRALSSPAQLTTALLAKHPGDRMSIAWSDGTGSHRATIVLGLGPAL
jgi:S1-C subfamily serine protease